MTIHKWALFEKTSSPIWLKMAQMMLIGPLKMSHKSGLGHPSKFFHDGKIEIFGPSQSSTGIKGAADPMLPWKTPRDQGDLVWSDLAQNFSDFVIGSDGTVS